MVVHLKIKGILLSSVDLGANYHARPSTTNSPGRWRRGGNRARRSHNLHSGCCRCWRLCLGRISRNLVGDHCHGAYHPSSSRALVGGHPESFAKTKREMIMSWWDWTAFLLGGLTFFIGLFAIKLWAWGRRKVPMILRRGKNSG